MLSPDGRYLAYASNESGRFEVYVRPFPEGPGKWQISTGGAGISAWSADGTELFYQEGSALMAVAVSTQDGFALGASELLFESDDLQIIANSDRFFSVFPDGQSFATFALVNDKGVFSPERRVRIVQNWYEEFRDRQR